MRVLAACVLSCGTLLAQAPAAAAFRPMALFGDHMVLPRAAQVPVWGEGEPGAAVAVVGSWGAKGDATVAADGRWRCDLRTPAQPGPFQVTLQSGAARIVLQDVLVGDVWLGSGQSNMEMPIGDHGGWKGGVRDWQAEVAAAEHPQLRVFTVQPRTSGAPLADVGGTWQVCSPSTAAAFSASAYFFGRELLQRGKGPIGVVVSAWGGTVCEAWASEQGLAQFPEFAAALAATKVASPAARSGAVGRFWQALADRPVATTVAVEATLPELWSKAGLADFDGAATYDRIVALPVAMRGKDLWLELGPIDDMDTVWCNGVQSGGHEEDGAWNTPRRYRLPAAAVGAGEQVALRVRVVDTGGEGGFAGAPAHLRLVLADDASVAVPLAGTWERRLGAALRDLPPWPRREDGGPNRPAVLWNAMVAPLLPFPFAGAIWYQGESNRARHAQYARLFPAMIRDWRRAFGRDLPFYFVQIAPFGYGGDAGETALLREAQAAALHLPHTGMVVTLDIGDAKDIHPRDKQSVGRRLALQALRGCYGEAVVADGPRARAAVRQGRVLRIVCDGCEGGLVLEPGGAGFEISGADGVFRPAAASIDGEAVLLQADGLDAPVQARYGWAAAPVGSLRNGAGLPAGPFRLAAAADGR